MRSTALGVFTAAGLVLLAGCSHNPALSGQVRGPDGALAEAQIRILDASDQEVQQARTDQAGKFAVRGRLEPRPYTLEVQMAGYQTARKTVSLPQAGAVELELVRLSTIRGKVHLPNGGVVPGATVRFLRGQDKAREVSSGEDGNYTMVGLDPGNYLVEASAEQGGLRRSISMVQVGGADQTLDLELVSAALQVDGICTETRQPEVIQDFNVPVSNP